MKLCLSLLAGKLTEALRAAPSARQARAAKSDKNLIYEESALARLQLVVE